MLSIKGSAEHQVRWTYQPGSHRRKVTQEFSSAFLLRCVPQLFSREGFDHPFPSSTVKSNFCTNDFIVLHSLGIFITIVLYFMVRKIPITGIELKSQRFRRLRGYLRATGATGLVHVLKDIIRALLLVNDFERSVVCIERTINSVHSVHMETPS